MNLVNSHFIYKTIMSYKNLKNLFEEQSLINDISGILNWDMATYMPENSRKQRIKQITKLYDYIKKIFLM